MRVPSVTAVWRGGYWPGGLWHMSMNGGCEKGQWSRS